MGGWVAKDDRAIRRRILAGRWEFGERFFAGVSDLAKDFIAGLLTFEPDRRPTAAEALAHPWVRLAVDGVSPLAGAMPPASASLQRWERDRLRGALLGFGAASPMQKVILEVRGWCGGASVTNHGMEPAA